MNESIIGYLVNERIQYYNHFLQKNFNGQEIKDMLSNIIEQSKKRGHDIVVGFKQGKAYCKKCGEFLE